MVKNNKELTSSETGQTVFDAKARRSAEQMTPPELARELSKAATDIEPYGFEWSALLLRVAAKRLLSA